MGGESSYPLLPETQQHFVLVGSNATEIPYTIPPGHPIISLNLQSNIIRHLPVKLLQLQTLILNDNSIQEISKEMEQALLSYQSLKTLELAQNQISEFKINIQSLETLDLTQNKLTTMPFLSENLQKASFDSNFIKILDKSSSTIKNLSISLNYIEKVDDSLKMDELEKLDISMNRICEIENFSAKFPSLQFINLSFNLLKEVQKSLSASIVEMDLSGNKIKTFSESIQYLTHLQKLDISFNDLSEIPKLPSSLKQIIANNNIIEKVEDSEISSLEFVTFSFNELECLPKFANHVAKSLFFSHNHIKTISLEMMTKSVEQLNLADNEITEIPIELFRMPNLRFLNLDSNKISEIPNEIEGSNLSILFISQNPVKKLPKLPKTLESLFACYCQIEDVSEIFKSSVRISKICLSGNKIKKFPSKNDFTFSHLQILSLSQCDIDQFPSEFLVNDESTCKVTTLDISFNAIKFIPINFSAPYLADFDLSHNQIESLPDIGRFPKLISLKLTNNPISCNMSFLKNAVLDSVDVTSIGASQISVPPKIREVLTTVNSLQPPYRFMQPIESGYAQFIGAKNDVSEDSICVRDDLDFYLICDGHNGSLTATTVANILPNCFQQEHKFEHDFFDAAISYVDEKLQNEFNVSDGASLVCAQASRKTSEIITAHLGDSCATIVTVNGKAKLLTKQHIATSRKEFNRILLNGGRVVNRKTDGTLSISRAIGDFGLGGLSNSPEFSHAKLEDEDKFLVLGCAALFDSLTCNEIAEVIKNCDSAWDAACRLKNIAFGRKMSSNLSAIVVPLNFKS